MRLHTSLRAALLAAATAAGSAGLAVAGGPAAHAAGPTIPAHVFSPYFEAFLGDSPAALSAQSGAKYLTMAFLQTASTGSCTVLWDGDTSTPVSATSFGSDIASIQAAGGDVIPSFGGFTADDTATEIADSCTDVSQIAAQYEKVITTYNVTRLDMDVEDNSLTNTAGIDRRNKAIKMVEDWAAANGRTVQFVYTLPTTSHGLAQTGLNVLRNAVTNNARVDVVNIMTFDYFDNAAHEMATDTMTAANGLQSQLATLYPDKTAAQRWAMTGVTEMVGIDDFGAAETFTTADAATVENWAVNQGIAELSFWALQRDNGGCPGTSGSNSCSGISQTTWFFSHAFEPFTSGGVTPPPPAGNDFSVSVTPGSAAVDPGSSASATVSTAVTAGSAQSVSLSASGAPAGASVRFSPVSVTAGGSATVTVTTTSTVAPGSYPITVTGTATSGSHSTTFTLTVNGAPGGGGPGCDGVAPWTTGVAYTGGMQVTFGGHLWTAMWWNFNATPGGPVGVWTDEGPC